MANLKQLFIKLYKRLGQKIAKAIETFFVGLLYIYRSHLSGTFGGGCRFSPSCSEYAQDCFANFGVAKATFLTTKRLLNCRPFGPYGYDPIPSTNCCTAKRLNEI